MPDVTLNDFHKATSQVDTALSETLSAVEQQLLNRYIVAESIYTVSQ